MSYKTARLARSVATSIGVGFIPAETSAGQSAPAALALRTGAKNASREDYAVADLVGRCFLRACYWFDVCTSWAKKYDRPAFINNHPKTAVKNSSAMPGTPVRQLQSVVDPRAQNSL